MIANVLTFPMAIKHNNRMKPMADRRRSVQSSTVVSIIAVCIAAMGLIIGPVLGAVAGAVGTYVTMSNKQVVTDTNLSGVTELIKALSGKVDRLSDKLDDSSGQTRDLATRFNNSDERTKEFEKKTGDTLSLQDLKIEKLTERVGKLEVATQK